MPCLWHFNSPKSPSQLHKCRPYPPGYRALDERNARTEFYRSIGQKPPANEDLIGECARTLEQSKDRTPDKSSHSHSYQQDPYYHRLDEQVHIQLEPGSDRLEPLRLKFLRLSSKATVTHLRKYVAQHVLHDISKFHDIDIFILNNENGTFLGRDHALKFVRVVYWNEEDPMLLQYRLSEKLV
ncbi:Polycomb group RING finger protein 3 [Sparganum proliferum]